MSQILQLLRNYPTHTHTHTQSLTCLILFCSEQQMDILDLVCAKLHEEAGIYKVLIGRVTLLFLFHLFYIYFFL